MQKVFSAVDLAQLDKYYRINLINALPGFRGANLIGSISEAGQTNLAIFSSVTHIGSHPPLLGFVTRPLVEGSRHTYANVKATRQFTINHVPYPLTAQAHQTSARYPAEVSEFDACGFTPVFSDNLKAPYVAESAIQIGLTVVDEIPIPLNQTLLVIGAVVEIRIQEHLLREDGFVQLDQANSAAVAGLDGYTQPSTFVRYAYAKPDQPTQRIDS
jgi:flavin reductase (DIM6/NTAB) family NADH-FMN oxidoreductase RutF